MKEEEKNSKLNDSNERIKMHKYQFFLKTNLNRIFQAIQQINKLQNDFFNE